MQAGPLFLGSASASIALRVAPFKSLPVGSLEVVAIELLRRVGNVLVSIHMGRPEAVVFTKV